MQKNKQQNEHYFEMQGRLSLRCGLHAVNNLLGRNQFDEQNFKEICEQLSQIANQSYQHPVFGGDYDVSALIRALEKKNNEIQWHDSRKEFKKELLKTSQPKIIRGYLVNVKMPQKLYHKLFRVSGRHWIAIKQWMENGKLMRVKLDSKEKIPVLMQQQGFYKYLEEERKKGGQILKAFIKQDQKRK